MATQDVPSSLRRCHRGDRVARAANTEALTSRLPRRRNVAGASPCVAETAPEQRWPHRSGASTWSAYRSTQTVARYPIRCDRGRFGPTALRIAAEAPLRRMMGPAPPKRCGMGSRAAHPRQRVPLPRGRDVPPQSFTGTSPGSRPKSFAHRRPKSMARRRPKSTAWWLPPKRSPCSPLTDASCVCPVSAVARW